MDDAAVRSGRNPRTIAAPWPVTAAATLAVLLAACGGGGKSSQPAPAPTVTLSSSAASVSSGAAVTLTWSSTGATGCQAGGAWSGTRATSGTTSSGPLTTASTFSLTCTSAGGSTTRSVTVSISAPPTFTLSGRLIVTGDSQTDSDTNDIILPPVSNNGFGSAQTIPNPVMLGGYASVAGAGKDGPLKTSGDVNDVYRVSLLKGQSVHLAVATPEEGDLDLYLYTTAQTVVDSALGTGYSEDVVAPNAGDYYVRVTSYSGASNYALSIAAGGTTALSDLRLSSEFVPGEILFRERKAGVATKAGESTASAADVAKLRTSPAVVATLAASYGLTSESYEGGSYALLKLSSNVAALSSTSDGDDFLRFDDPESELKYRTLLAIKSLRRDSRTEWAEVNGIARTHAAPNDPEYRQQRWHYEMISLPEAFDITTGSADVVVAVVDSGVQRHPDLAPKLVDGYDFVSAVSDSGDGDGDDADPSDPGQPVGNGYKFHGTHVAGTIGAVTNNGSGVAGVGGNVRIMPVRVLGLSNGTDNDIMEGIRYAAGLSNRSRRLPSKRADIINLSLGRSRAGTCPAAYQQVFNEVRAAGVIVVASAGNDSEQASRSPANCAGVISVSAVDSTRARASYSNAGTGVDVAAPGGDGSSFQVYSTSASFNGSTYSAAYTAMSGTSMAAPHVSGVIALMKSVNPALTPADVDAKLSAGLLTDDIGPPGADELGVGLINALKAVRAASSAPPATRPAQLYLTPSTLSLGDQATTGSVVVANGGTDAVTVTGTVSSAPWLTVIPLQLYTAGLGEYRVMVDRASLAPGTYGATVEFRASAGTAVRLAVQIQVGTAAATGNAGEHYVLLEDAATGEDKMQVEVLARGPSTPFAFANVPAGRYTLVAGTDLDNDGYICDDGEACTEYPLFGDPMAFDVAANRTGLDMTTGFGFDVRASSLAVEDGYVPRRVAPRRVRK